MASRQDRAELNALNLRQGVKELALEQRLALIVRRVEGLLSDGALSSYLYGIRD